MTFAKLSKQMLKNLILTESCLYLSFLGQNFKLT